LAQNKCGGDPIFDGEAGAKDTFAVATKRGLYFFSYNGQTLDDKRGLFNGNEMAPQICVTFNEENGNFYSGTSTGFIY